MDFAANYEIARTADFIRSRNFTRVALQFPDDLLKDSVKVAGALRDELRSVQEAEGLERKDVGIFVMADATYGSCCVDEVGASHVDADCVIHYGHSCMSPTSTLPALFVFGKASIDVDACVESLFQCLSTNNKPILVLFGLEYAHSIQSIKEIVAVESSRLSRSKESIVCYADVVYSVMDPSECGKTLEGEAGPFSSNDSNGDLPKCVSGSNVLNLDLCKQNAPVTSTSYSLGGLTWNLPQEHSMENYLLFWIGSGNSAFANIVLTFNNCEIVRYDAEENQMVRDFFHQNRILKHRYYLVEKAKDANIVGILVGTLGVAGYLHMIDQMRELIKRAGKKAYTLAMGRPNPAKLANFPECDVFIYVSCAETALLDSKEFLSPVITPFEAMLAFNRGSQWTGEYVMGFRDLMASASPDVSNGLEEGRFSFFKGGYLEDLELEGKAEEEMGTALMLADETEKALKVGGSYSTSGFVRGIAKSGAEFFASRSYHGLDIQSDKAPPHTFVLGRTGKASGYNNEKT